MEENRKKPLTAKNRSPFHFLRVAFYVLRRRSKGKSAVPVVEKSAWRRIMCSMRPLQPQCLQPTTSVLPIKGQGQDDSFHDIAQLPPPASPDYALPRVYEDGMSSRYTSAEDLHELGGSEVDVVDDLKGIEEGLNCDDDHPNEIDMQAEEFIAKFYEQMRLQRVESLERHNNWLEKQALEEEEKKEEGKKEEEKEA